MSEFERCLQCDKLMRPQTVRAKDAPGTVARSGRGICNTCHSRNRRMYGPGYHTRLKPSEISTPTRASLPSSGKGQTSSGITRGGFHDFPSVLVRLDLRPSTFRILRRAGIDIHAELSKYADKLADQVGDLDA